MDRSKNPDYQKIIVLDERLRKFNLRRVEVPIDGNCFFHSVSKQLALKYPDRNLNHSSLRSKCVSYLKANDTIGAKRGEHWKNFLEDENEYEYVSRMQRDGEWVDHLMIQATASYLDCIITIITTAGEEDDCVMSIYPKSGSTSMVIYIGHIAEKHYFSAEYDAMSDGDIKPQISGFSIRSTAEAKSSPIGAKVPRNVPPKSALKTGRRRTEHLHPKFQHRDSRDLSAKKSVKHEDEESAESKIKAEWQKNFAEEEDEDEQEDEQEDENFKQERDFVALSKRKPQRQDSLKRPAMSRERDIDGELDHLLRPKNAKEEKEKWDAFEVVPPEDTGNSTGNYYKFFTRVGKYMTVVVFSLAVLLGAIASEGSLLVLTNAFAMSFNNDDTRCNAMSGTIYERYNIMLILLTCLVFPEALSLAYSLYRIIMKHEQPMIWDACFLGMIPEILHAIGLTILILRVVPYIDATISVLMFSLVGFMPALLHTYAKYRSIRGSRGTLSQASVKARRMRDFGFGVASLILQPAGIAALCWQIDVTFIAPATAGGSNVIYKNSVYITAGISLLLISCRYWENFVTGDIQVTKSFKIKVSQLQRNLDRTRFKTGAIYAILRAGVIVATTFLIYLVIDNNTNVMQTRGKDGQGNPIDVTYINYQPSAFCHDFFVHFWNAAMTHCFCGLAVFFFGRVACQTEIQVQAYTFPLIMVSPIMCALTAINSALIKPTGELLMAFFFPNAQAWEHVDALPTYYKYIGWTSSSMVNTPWHLTVLVVAGLAAGWLTIIFLTFYLWRPKQVRLARTEALFIKPIYGGVLISQDMMLNRRQYQSAFSERKRLDEETDRQRKLTRRQSSMRRSRRLTVNMNRQFVPQVFLCATMWHETEQEMTQLLTSIMRLDRDQAKRRPNARKDRDYYNFQVHIMFDDAMEKTAEGMKPNKFVHQLIRLIDTAANKVELGKGEDVTKPVIYPTPYGGRLEFVLPWGNLFHVHLKDKSKIRHRKRWSQCMYMYYILGYLQQAKKAFKKEDVFVLALDGDVDFQPESLLLLIDRMKRNPDVGAACGRIHPIGSGPVVWFQKFEYAVGHWLQKTAEHVLGCVLCSPGCFSLFRGEALMDTNVVKMYTTKPSEARHYIQWDQGEDRWLCTLLLKQGWRIEYSAASDSYTFAPEEFKEFYNQRRRWGPSTMANVFDILQDSKITVKNNEYISWGYISYQMGLMASSILGPATVVLVVQGAFQYVFGMTPIGSLLVALIPIVIFVILCYTTKPDFQIAVAGILTIIYALVMMAVLVGIVGQMTDALLNPNSIFMLAMIFMYAFTGIIHPTEMLCLMHGMLYYLCVPSAFILLMVYSLCNMNNVSWGTRETRAPVQAAEEQQKKELEQKELAKDGKKKTMSLGNIHASSDDGYDCGCGNFCKISCCFKPTPPSYSHPHSTMPYQRLPTHDPHQQPYQQRRSTMHRHVTGFDREETIRKYSIAKAKFMGESEEDPAKYRKSLSHRMSVVQLRDMQGSGGGVENVTSLRKSIKQRRDTIKKENEGYERAQKLAKEVGDEAQRITGYDDDSDGEEVIDEDRERDEEREGLYWIVDGPMQDGLIDYLDDKEHEFWRKMIDQYLLPLEEDKKEKARIESDLIALKNKMTGAYFLINALWIVLTFSLTLAISDINITFYDRNGNEIVLQPLAFLFLIFFLVILVIQFLTMLVHRWSTFVHLMAVTTFGLSKNKMQEEQSKKPKDSSDEDKSEKKQKKKKKKDKRATIASDTDVEGATTFSTHDNQAFEDSNFSYGGGTLRGNGIVTREPPRIQNVSDTSDLEEPHVVDIPGSIKWKTGSQGLAAAVAATGGSQPDNDNTYAEIQHGHKDSIDLNNIFTKQPEPNPTGFTFDPKPSENPYDDVVVNVVDPGAHYDSTVESEEEETNTSF